MLDRTVASIQGLCRFLAEHYTDGIPPRDVRHTTFRDLVRKDNMAQQQEIFRLRGEFETKSLEKLGHAIGRTSWDRARARELNPEILYHFCNETLRQPFFEGSWQYAGCRKYRIFASSCVYPVKGFHYLLEAFREVLKAYPEATLAVPGSSFFTVSRLRQSGYQKYLAGLAAGLEDKIEFLGDLNAEEMKQAYLNSHVFVMPSTIENSSNSLGEAMLLGMPCVASMVGGTKDLLTDEKEGFFYQSSAPYMLAYEIGKVFSMEEKAGELGQAARAHAARTHDPETNLKTLLSIYREVSR